MELRHDSRILLVGALVQLLDLDGNVLAETYTDENGYFEFPPFFERSIAKYLPMEFVVGQKIIVTYEGKEYEMWSGVKRKPEENVESRGKPLVVECELSGEEKLIEVNGGPIFSLCTWDVEPDPKEDPRLLHGDFYDGS